MDAKINDAALRTCAPNDLNRRSLIRNRITATIDRFGEGATLAEQMLSQLDSNKAALSIQVDEAVAREANLEEQRERSEDVAALAEDFSDKTEPHGCCMIA